MPAERCRPQIFACAIRVAKLYASGVPAQGASNLLTTDALVSLGYSAEVRAGDEHVVTNACGNNCLDYQKEDKLRRLNLTLNICYPHPYLTEFLVGGAVLTDGEAVGYGFPTLNDPDDATGISLELWAQRQGSTGTLDADFPYAWWVFPKVVFQIDSGSFENGPHTPTFNGRAYENENWFDGPNNDFPVDSDKVAQWIPTIGLPTTDCEPTAIIAS